MHPALEVPALVKLLYHRTWTHDDALNKVPIAPAELSFTGNDLALHHDLLDWRVYASQDRDKHRFCATGT
jgi:hypothetical protein